MLMYSGLLVVAAAIIFLVATTVYAAVIAAPFVSTPKRVIKKALEAVDLGRGEKIYDLGSGTGRVLVMAAREFGAVGIGYELSLPVFIYSKVKIFLSGCSNGVSILWNNFFQASIADADVVFIWLTPKGNRKLEQKLKKELRAGTRVVVYSSPLLFWQPERVIESRGYGKIFVYRKT